MSRKTIKLIIAFGLVYIIWGSTYLGIRIAIDSIPPFIMAGARHVVAGIILFGISRIKDKDKITLKHIKSNGIVGALLLLIGNGGVVWAEKIVPSGLTALLVSIVPIWILIINRFFLKKTFPSLKQYLGVFLGFIGLLLLISPTEFLKADSIDPIGTLILMGATIAWSIGSVYTQSAEMPSSKITAISLQMLIGGLLLVITSILFGEYKTIDFIAITIESWLSLIYLIIFGSLIAYSAYIWLLHTAGPSLTSTYAFVNPVVAVFLGWLILNEPMNLRVIVSSLVIITAVVIITTEHTHSFKISNSERKIK